MAPRQMLSSKSEQRNTTYDVPPAATLDTAPCLGFGDVSCRLKPGARKDWRVPADCCEQHGLRKGV
eukprot:3413685-Prymnesium_polylepis.1